MARRNLLRDSSSHAAGELDYILRERSKAAAPEKVVPTVPVDEALRAARMVQHKSTRDITRVLFISQNTELLNPTQQSLDGYIDVADMFDEVHIIVLRQGIQPRQPVFRPAKHVWIYTVATRYWWQLPSAAKKLMQEQLLFADGFRPDLVVARDPFESALATLWAAKEYGRSAQLHLTKKVFGLGLPEDKVGLFRKMIARYTIARFASIRVSSQAILSEIQSIKKTPDAKILPQLNPYESIANQRATLDLKEKYPQYIFSLLCVTHYQDESALAQMLDGVLGMLRNQKVCLIIVGDGPAKSFFKKRAKLLKIEEQIIYDNAIDRGVQYMKSAQLLLVPGTDPASDEIVLQAASAGIPMIAVTNEFREEVFTDRESIYFCRAADKMQFELALTVMMNNFAMRTHIAEQAQAKVITYFHQDPEEYKRAYQASVESALFADESNTPEEVSIDNKTA